MKLVECVAKHNGGFDISDRTWDWGEYFDCADKLKNCGDYYDKVQWVLGKEIEVDKFDTTWFTVCDISGFIMKNIDVFNEFLNDVNREEWQPQNWEKQPEQDDEEFYELYIEGMFQDLLAGGYSEKSYEKLYRIMEKYGLTEGE